MEQNQPVQTQMTPKAIAVMILGIATFVFGWCAIVPVAGIVFGAIGIILGIITLSLSGSGGRALAANPSMYHGQGLRKTGKIFGIIGFVLSILFFLIWIILVVFLKSSNYNFDRMF